MRCLLASLLFPLCLFAGSDGVPEILELKFGADTAAAELPGWFSDFEQDGGQLVEGQGWTVAADQPFGSGKLTFKLDRAVLNNDLALTTRYTEEDGDLAVQLFDDQGRVLVVDLFANVIKLGKAARTDTVIVPLSKYPSASRIVLRRLSGGLSVQGVVMFPVLKPVAFRQATLKELAALLGDPLSPDNPLVRGVSRLGEDPLDVSALNRASENRGAAKVIQQEQGRKVQLRITGNIDGSEEIHITRDGARWKHKHWSWPSGVELNGVKWNPARNRVLANTGKTTFLPAEVNFGTARVLLAKGRDVAAMVPTADKLIVYLSDSPNGSDRYEMVISLEAR